MAAGLPILISRNCGCSPDLCHSGQNGYNFDPSDTKQIAGLMLKMSSARTHLASMGKMSKKIIADYNPQNWANTVHKMVWKLLEIKENRKI
jgi:glycosyltransferase involved in cell wall biosynthesis